MTYPFTELTDRYGDFQKELEQLGLEDTRARAQELLDDIREAGKYIVNPEQRGILSNLARDLGETVFDLSDTYPSVRLKSPPAHSEQAILDALYDHFLSAPGSPSMTFAELYKALGISQNDTEKLGEFRHDLLALTDKGWIELQFLADGNSAVAVITPDGTRTAEDGRQFYSMSSLESDIARDFSDQGKCPPQHDTSKPCPLTLADLMEGDPTCARLIQRDELLTEIIDHFERTLDRHHYVVLYGQPMAGKTRLLIHLSEVVSEKYAPLMVTMQGLELGNALDDLDAFAFDLADQLTNKFIKWTRRRGLPSSLRPNWDDFKEKGRIAFETHWDNLLEIADESRPLVIIDEVERLLDFHGKLDPHILAFLDYFVCNPDNGYFILAGSERSQFSANHQFSMLIAKGQPIRVGSYDNSTTLAVFSKMEQYVACDERVLQSLVTLCDGHPRIVQAAMNVALPLACKRPGKPKLTESDIEPILTSLMERTDMLLWELCRRLSREELFVVRLVSQEVSSPTDRLEYSLPELVTLADQQFPNSSVDHNDLIIDGIANLERREWIEWEDWAQKRFCFKLGIVPLWIQRHRIDFDEVAER